MAADERGQTLVLAALAMTALMGFLGLSIDVGIVFWVHRGVQTAADSAAITAAQELNFGDSETAAKADAARNGFTHGVNNVTIDVNNPPLNGPHTGASGYVEVIVTKQQSTIFMQMLTHTSLTIKGRAVGSLGPTQNCLYALGTSGTDISATNGATAVMPGCTLFGNSTGSTDLNVTGNGSISASGINLVGNYNISNGGTTSPAPTKGIPPVSDPLSSLAPPTFSPASCVADPHYGGGGTFLNQGPATSGGTICYNGLSIGNGATVTLKPGLYIINGQLSLSGGSPVSGTGLTFYLPVGGSLYIGNGASFNVTAPTSGTYNGILFYQDRSNTTAEDIQGGVSSSLQGILYFPSAAFTFQNGSNTSTYASIIAKTVTFTGGSTVKNYATINTSTPLSSPRLLE